MEKEGKSLDRSLEKKLFGVVLEILGWMLEPAW